MNNAQSGGAMLVLLGLGVLWAIWSDRSPFNVLLTTGKKAA